MNILTLLNIETYPLAAKETHKKAVVSEQHFCATDASSGIYKVKLSRNCIPGAPAPLAAAALVKQQAGNGRLQRDFPWQHLTQA